MLIYVCHVNADENAALAIAVKDIQSLPVYDRPFIRYIYMPSGKQEDLQLTSLTLNYISRASTIVRPLPIDKTMVRVDLRHYAPREKDFEEFSQTWYNFTFDPMFSLLLTKDTLKFSQIILQSGDLAEGKIIGSQDVAKVLSPHIDAKLFATLVLETGSAAPVVNHRYFITRALSTIQDKGVFKTIYGGLYYDFIGIKTGAKKGTDEDVLFEQLGVGDIESGVTAAKIFDKLRSDSRLAVFRSGITGRPRRVDFLRTLAGRIEDNASLISVTHDIKQQDIDRSEERRVG